MLTNDIVSFEQPGPGLLDETINRGLVSLLIGGMLSPSSLTNLQWKDTIFLLT